MSAMDSNKKLLSSWKEIAAYLKCGIRTCKRWEQLYGLPIHRVDNKSRTTVYAYKDELDKWLKKKKEKIKSSSIWVKLYKSPFLYLFFSIFGLIAGYFLFIKKTPLIQPTDFRIHNSELIILDEKGEEIWFYDTGIENLVEEKSYREHYQYKKIINESRLLPVLAIKDINGDDFNEVLFSIVTQDGYGAGDLFCFDHNGRKLWKFEAGKEMVYGKEIYSPDYRVHGFDVCDFDNDGNFEIAVISSQIPYFPTQLVILNTRGEKLGEYWNAGRLQDIEFLDLNEDGKKEIIVAGMNNEYGKSCIAVFDSLNIQGGSPQENGFYKCNELESGTEKYYILLPRIEWAYNKILIEPVEQIKSLKNNRISFITKFSRVIYEFSFDLKILKVRPSHTSIIIHDEALREGRVEFDLDEQYIEQLSNSILYYDGQNWISIPTLTSNWKNKAINN